MFCPQCKAEYRHEFKRCSDCDVELVDQLPAEPPTGEMSGAKLVVVGTYVNEFDADLAKGALDSAGIEAMIRRDDVGSQSPNLDISRGINVLVRTEDVKDAVAVLSSEATEEETEAAEAGTEEV